METKTLLSNESCGARTWFVAAAFLVGIAVVSIRLIALNRLQREVYGDIELVHRYLLDILAGNWPFYFALSSGPLYHYLIAPLVWVGGNTYPVLKLASVLVSLGVLGVTFAFARRLEGDWFALLSTLLAGASSWLLIFSRLGNSQILVPLLAMSALWGVLRIVERGRSGDYVACAVVAAMGLYAYPQSFVLPGVVFATLLALRWTGKQVDWRGLGLFAVVTLLSSLPLMTIVWAQPNLFFGAYIAGKLHSDSGTLSILLQNTVHAMAALHWRGDMVFVSNPMRLPHLDPLSGALLAVGSVYWLGRVRRDLAPILFVPLLLLQIPSILVFSQPAEVPSASRTLAIAPLCSVLVASGIWWLTQVVSARHPRLGIGFAIVATAAILAVNADRYFRQYIGGLPYHDIPVGQLIADFTDSLAPNVNVYLVGCCWRYGMPEPEYTQIMSQTGFRLHRLATDASCKDIERTESPVVLVWSPDEPIPGKHLGACIGKPVRFVGPGNAPTFNASTFLQPPQEWSASSGP